MGRMTVNAFRSCLPAGRFPNIINALECMERLSQTHPHHPPAGCHASKGNAIAFLSDRHATVYWSAQPFYSKVTLLIAGLVAGGVTGAALMVAYKKHRTDGIVQQTPLLA